MVSQGEREGLGRSGWLLLGALVVAIGIAVWDFWLQPTRHERAQGIQAACADSAALLDAGLLDEARIAYRRLADHTPQGACPTGADEEDVVAREAEAAKEREQGDQYLQGARLSRKTQGATAKERFARARLVAVRRAVSGYVRSLQHHPFQPETRTSLRSALGLLGVPGDTEANQPCDVARALVEAHLLAEARILYGQALRTGRTTRCVARQLRVARDLRAEARRGYRQGQMLEADGKEKDARQSYITALTIDPSATEARKALAMTEAPDPRAGTLGGQLADVGAALGAAVSALGDAASWLGDHAGALSIGFAALVGLLLLAMLGLLLVTRFEWGRSVVARFYTPRFTKRQLRVAPFSPTDTGATSTTVFVDWLSQPFVDPDPGEKALVASDSPIDIWVGDTDSAAADVVALLSGLQPGVGAALATFARNVAPRREVRLAGYTLARCEHGPGLRVLMLSRRGRPQAAKLWWATDLPGPPLIEEDDEDEARHVLAIQAATWAQYAVRAP